MPQMPAEKPAGNGETLPAKADTPLASRHRTAQRMAPLLLRELGTGIEVKRMLAQPLYARDVLLVCDAMRGSELAALAEQFRAATRAEAEAEAAGQPGSSLWPDSSANPSSLWPKTWFRSSRQNKPK